MVQSFEVVVYVFAQQLSINETQNFTLSSLTVVAELVSLLDYISVAMHSKLFFRKVLTLLLEREEALP